MKSGTAFVAGIIGGLAMTLGMAVGRMIGLDVNFEMMLGTMIGLPTGALTWVFGLVMHLFISGLIGLLYALGFEYLVHRAGTTTGTAFSVLHTLLGGLFLAIVPAIHPIIPQQIAAPGAFLSNEGFLGVGAFLVLHIAYGAIVGAGYGTVIHQAVDRPMPRTRTRPA